MVDIDNSIIIYTDGGCHGNPGAGGWGAVIIDDEKEILLSGGDKYTTNNRMELTAAIKALEYANEHFPEKHIELFTDSQYLKNGITDWIVKWKKKNWMRKKDAEVLNKELWQQLDALNSEKVKWNWVKGHAEIKYNEICDELCQTEIGKLKGKKWEKEILVFIYSDFDAKTNSGKWHVKIADDKGEKVFSGVENSFTVVFKAAETALLYLSENCGGRKAEIRTNSDYLVCGNTFGKKLWLSNGWLKSDKTPVKYREFWEKLYSLYDSNLLHWKLLGEKVCKSPQKKQPDLFSEKNSSENTANFEHADTFIITEKWLRENTNCGAVNAKQLRAIGLSWPPQDGWLRNMIGKEISTEAKRKFESLKKPRKSK